jgi:hypothetical protein
VLTCFGSGSPLTTFTSQPTHFAESGSAAHRDGAKFGTIAKQFGSHLCLSPILSKGWQIDRRLVVVRYEGKVPAMASCSNCKRKFFTPTALARDAVAAEEYLVAQV